MTSKLPDLRESPFSSFEEVSRSHSPQQRTPTQGSNSTDSIELTTPRSASQSPLDPLFTPEQLQHNAAATIQAAVRGHFVRKRMVRPEHIDQEIAEILKTIDLAKQAKATAKQPQKSSSFDSDLSIASMSDSGSAILPGLPTAQREITPSELSSSGSAILPGFPTAQREITPSELNSISSALASQVREIAFAKEQPPKGHRTRLSTPDAPIDAWVTKIKSDLFEIEIIGEHKGRGAQTEVSASYILNLTLRSGGPKKTTKKVALAKFQTKHGQKIKMALDLLKTHFPEPDANLRIIGQYSHLDRITGEHIEARDTLMKGDFSREFAKLKKDEKLQVLSDVAYTLNKIHAAGLVHRDIKPNNLFIGEDNRGYLGDIEGLAGFIQPNEERDPIGTPGYIGRGPGDFGDIFSFAVTCSSIYGHEQNPFKHFLDQIEASEEHIYSTSKLSEFQNLESDVPELRKDAYERLHSRLPAYREFMNAVHHPLGFS